MVIVGIKVMLLPQYQALSKVVIGVAQLVHRCGNVIQHPDHQPVVLVNEESNCVVAFDGEAGGRETHLLRNGVYGIRSVLTVEEFVDFWDSLPQCVDQTLLAKCSPRDFDDGSALFLLLEKALL